jgi:hypothetical protein
MENRYAQPDCRQPKTAASQQIGADRTPRNQLRHADEVQCNPWSDRFGSRSGPTRELEQRHARLVGRRLEFSGKELTAQRPLQQRVGKPHAGNAVGLGVAGGHPLGQGQPSRLTRGAAVGDRGVQVGFRATKVFPKYSRSHYASDLCY